MDLYYLLREGFIDEGNIRGGDLKGLDEMHVVS